MIISVKKRGLKKYQFNEYFKTVDELGEFIKTKNKFINPINLKEKLEKIYNELTVLNMSLRISELYPMIRKKLDFKYKKVRVLNFWIERGFTIDDFNEYLSKDENNQMNVLSLDSKNEFKYGVFKFDVDGIPTCNICKSNLILEAKVNRYNIIGCTNDCCASHNNKDVYVIRQLAFLPPDVFMKKNNRINFKSKVRREYWLLKGFSYEESLKKSNEVKNEIKGIKVYSFEHFKKTTDMTDDEIRYYVNSRTRYRTEYWVKNGYSEEEAIDMIKKLQYDNSKKAITLRKQFPENYSAITETQIGYWLKKGYNEEEALLKLSERQKTFSLQKCIEKYGEEDGIDKFTERQIKWSNSLVKNGNLKNGFSKISQDLFNILLKNYDDDDKDNIFFAKFNGEFSLPRENGGLWLYDFTDLKNKKIIEFNGDMYHGNPNTYDADDTPHPFRKDTTAKEIWAKDEIKLNVAKNNGFDVLVVWDSEYRWGSKSLIINKCVNFLNNK
jgi:hypothetical protein